MSDLKLSSTASACYHAATELAKARSQAFITLWHMALALLEDDVIQKALTALEVPQGQLKAVLVSWVKPCDPNLREKNPNKPTHNAELLELMGTALIISGDKPVIDTTDIFLAMLSDGGTRFSLHMISHGVDFAKAESYFLQESCMSGGDAS
jgi:ATP-dependent Clp protease ATP-binding subunit ClpA